MLELIKAVRDEKLHEIFKLISTGVDVNEPDEHGKRPLHYSLNAQIVKVLISAGADVNATDKQGKTPLDYAPNAKITKVLVDSGGIRTVAN
ncbi:MAG: ankyrin repeat domain-containing protein [Lentisphaeraceae bacterium]|nr:ankyrin repeat domain-containing protein [Lentisphaeraceae bacterium]